MWKRILYYIRNNQVSLTCTETALWKRLLYYIRNNQVSFTCTETALWKRILYYIRTNQVSCHLYGNCRVETYSLLHQKQPGKLSLVRKLPCGNVFSTTSETTRLAGTCTETALWKHILYYIRTNQVSCHLYGNCPVETYSLLHQKQPGKLSLVRKLPCGNVFSTTSETTR